MERSLMLAVARAPLAPQALEAFAPRGVEKVVRPMREGEQFSSRRLKLVHARRFGGGEVCAHALARAHDFDKPAEVFERACEPRDRAGRETEGPRNAAERLGQRKLSDRKR